MVPNPLFQAFERADPKRSLTFVTKRDEQTADLGHLVDEGVRLGQELVGLGVGSGDRVAAYATETFAFPISCLAIWYCGAAVVPLRPFAPATSKPDWERQTQAVIDKAGARLLTLDQAGPPTAFLDPATTRHRDPDHGPSKSAIAFVLFTSGSTSAPKGAAIGYEAMLSRLQNDGWPAPVKGDRLLNRAPVHSAAGVAGLFRPLLNGVDVVWVSPSLVAANGGRWLMEISRRRMTRAQGPNFAYRDAARAIERGLPEPVDLSALRTLGCGGEAIDPLTIRRFFEVAEPLGLDPDIFVPGYALAECDFVTGRQGLHVDRVDRDSLRTGRAIPTAREGASEFVSLGPTTEGAELRVADEKGDELPERTVGRLSVRSPRLMQGYLDDEEATAAVLIDGWLTTGDIGYLAEGELYVTGRLKETIIVRGRNIYPEDVEGVVRRLPAVQRCAAVGVHDASTETLVVVCETEAVDDELESLRRDAVRGIWTTIGISPRVLFVAPGVIPRNDVGKIMRTSLVEDIERGRFSESMEQP